jgi:diaminohydroxyphosphoribosylaminopyrimidine deaminase/5-amino-6-(5-phosphoribosylamino)uracil reductase
VTLKRAATVDVKIATESGDARCISNADSRQWVDRLRIQVDAVLVGVETVRVDNPRLTCRIPRGRNPWRVILDSRLRIPMSAQVLRQRDPEKTIVATSTAPSAAKASAIEALGAKVWRLPIRQDRVSWLPLLRKLAGSGIVNVMIEGGATIAASALKEKIVDKVVFFYAPKILGGDGRVMLGGLGIRSVRQAIRIKHVRVRKSGGDLMVSGYL